MMQEVKHGSISCRNWNAYGINTLATKVAIKIGILIRSP